MQSQIVVCHSSKFFRYWHSTIVSARLLPQGHCYHLNPGIEVQESVGVDDSSALQYGHFAGGSTLHATKCPDIQTLHCGSCFSKASTFDDLPVLCFGAVFIHHHLEMGMKYKTLSILI